MSALRAAIVFILAASATSALAEQITCESNNRGGAEPCGTVAAGSTVRLARQLGDAQCVEGRTWGTGPDHDSIWVSGGCRAVFDVQPPYSSGSTRSGEPQDYDNDDELDRGDANGPRNSYHADEPVEQDDRHADALPPRDNAPMQRDDSYADPPPRDDRYNDDRDTVQRDRQDNGYRDDRPVDDRDARRYARAERRDTLKQACVDQAAVGQRFGPDRIEASDARRIDRGLYSVDLDTPTGPVECIVDSDGRVRSLDSER